MQHSGRLRSLMEVRFYGYTVDRCLSIPQQAIVSCIREYKLLRLHVRYGMQSGDVFFRRGVPPPLDYYCGSSSTPNTLTCLICAKALKAWRSGSLWSWSGLNHPICWKWVDRCKPWRLIVAFFQEQPNQFICRIVLIQIFKIYHGHWINRNPLDNNVQYQLNGEHRRSVSHQRDLGVIVDETSKPHRQCAKAAKSANSIMRAIKTSFMNNTPTLFDKLYGTFIRPHLEYSFQAWWPWLRKGIKLLEDVQRRSTKLVKGLQDIAYEGSIC